jgi:hypothetical protein
MIALKLAPRGIFRDEKTDRDHNTCCAVCGACSVRTKVDVSGSHLSWKKRSLSMVVLVHQTSSLPSTRFARSHDFKIYCIAWGYLILTLSCFVRFASTGVNAPGTMFPILESGHYVTLPQSKVLRSLQSWAN